MQLEQSVYSASVCPCKITEAEEHIAPAIREGLLANMPLTILADSQQDCTNFLHGRISTPAVHVLAQIQKEDKKDSYIQTVL